MADVVIEQLEKLGIVSPSPSRKTSMSKINADAGSPTAHRGRVLSVPSTINTLSLASSPVEDYSTAVGASQDPRHGGSSPSPDLNPVLQPSRNSLIFRPPTPPPPASQGPRKITFKQTATGLVPTNLSDPPDLPPYPATPPLPSLPLNRKPSKENFTALVRTHTLDPDPRHFKLNDLLGLDCDNITPTPHPAEAVESGHKSIGLIRGVFRNSRNKRRDSSASGKSSKSDGSLRRSSSSQSTERRKDCSDPFLEAPMAVDDGNDTKVKFAVEEKAGRASRKNRMNKKGSKDEGSTWNSEVEEMNADDMDRTADVNVKKNGKVNPERKRSKKKVAKGKGEGRKLYLWEEI